jgi:colanic acid biosynthesis glycosyl transferase WcaI
VKILFVSQYFPPEMGAPAARVYELTRSWARAGHDVCVLTGFPNHPTGVVPPEYRGELVRQEEIDGIHVLRVPIYAAANAGFVRRVANYVSYGLSASLVGPWLAKRPDVLIATSPQMLTALAGLWVAGLKRVPFVFEVRDLWPRSIVEVGAMKAGTPAVRLLEGLERFLYRRADRIVAVTDSFVDEIAATGVPRSKISVVTNGVDLELFSPRSADEARARLGLGDEFLVSYVGTHGMAHGLDIALDAAKELSRERIRFLFVGEGAEKAALKRRAREERIENVTFWDQRSRSEVADILSASNLCLVLLRDRPVFRTVIPSKIFEIMGSARPILTTVDGESRSIIERANAGIFCKPEASPLARTIRTLSSDSARLESMGNAGRRFVESHYSRDALANEYLQILSSVRSSYFLSRMTRSR